MNDKACPKCGSLNVKVNYHKNNPVLMEPNALESIKCFRCGQHTRYFSVTKRAHEILFRLLTKGAI